MRKRWFLLLLLSTTFFFFSFYTSSVCATRAACKDPYYWRCYGILHKCPPGCPKLCEVDCKLCKPYCACDKPGAVCQDPRFIGGDGIMFYFHGRMDKDFCLVSDTDVHVNAHFIGKKSQKGRDFTWVQSVGVLFGRHKLYIGSKKVSRWSDDDNNMLIQLDGVDIDVPFGDWVTAQSNLSGVKIRRAAAGENWVVVKIRGLVEMKARVVRISEEESRIHGYDITEEDCFAHLEMVFKFNSLSVRVDGVLGRTYRPGYRSRVKMSTAMPIMGGAEKFATSHLFATDCTVSMFRQRSDDGFGNEEARKS